MGLYKNLYYIQLYVPERFIKTKQCSRMLGPECCVHGDVLDIRVITVGLLGTIFSREHSTLSLNPLHPSPTML